MVSIWGEPEPNYKADQRFAENCKAMSNGRIQIETHSSGSLMPYTEYFDAIRAGVVDIVHGGGTYWVGKDPSLAAADSMFMIIGDVLKGMTWLWEYGGIELVREAYANWDLYFIGNHCYGYSGESMVFKKPVTTFDDFKGLKMRAPEDSAETFQALGANTITIPGAEIYTALSTGLIDGADWVSVGSNYRLKLHEVAPYYTRPGDYHVGSMGEITMRMDEWNALPDDIKAILINAGHVQAMDGWRMTTIADLTSMGLIKEAGGQMIVWEPEVREKIQELYIDSLKRRTIKTDLGQKILDHVEDFLKVTSPE
jgi:TRAP-type mannitol/chloroaromatic compound transport system substrate-binding protein